MKFGDTEIYVISDGTFRLDGGAMFGVVPRVLWERLQPPDEKNRILLGLNCLLIVRGSQKVLVDTGIGDKYDAKFADIYDVRQEKTLLDGLAQLGLQPEDITHVIMSHMHFDHIGWNTRKRESGEVVPTFPNAVYFAQRGEYEFAHNPDPRSRASYLKWNWEPLEQRGMLKLIDGTQEILPGIESIVTGGHTRDHTIVKVNTDRQTVVFLADLVPTASHLKTPYVMGYDLYPLQTMEVKPRVLEQAYEEHWFLVFEHDARVKVGYLKKVEDRFVVEPVEVDGVVV